MEKLSSAKDFLANGQPEKSVDGNYIPLDSAAAALEHGEYVQSGESCRVDILKDHFAWMRGFVGAWYGWPSSGKSSYISYMMMLKSIRDGWKWGIYSPEEMDTVLDEGKIKIKANRIYKNLAWIFSGKSWNRNFCEKHEVQGMTRVEELDALDFVTSHFYVIFPKDRRIESILENFQIMSDKNGRMDGFLIDPWNVIKMDNNKRADEMLTDAFIDVKQFAMLTNSCFNIISHPRSLREVKQGSDKHSPYKVVNQFMQSGGAAWDNKMDSQFSIERPMSHLDPRNPKVIFHNLKQRQFEIVGVNKGSVGDDEHNTIEFDFKKQRYYFAGVDIIDGTLKSGLTMNQGEIFDKNKLPF